ncbi:hypothetical protein TWF481_011055 [Arthrobotrys musiformis]|uniref:Lysine-specific metallo-endopeptidase domain-containing protein n=1 Tax=Arthrobotrys musiformis TaxID=47236 RepID=A0AAV9VXC4_9PEZI
MKCSVKKLAYRAILLFPLLLKPSSQAGISTCFQVVTQDLGACSPSDIQWLDIFYNDAVALLRAGLNLYDNYKYGVLNTFSQDMSMRNGLLFFGLMPQRYPGTNRPPSKNIPDDEIRWQTVRDILYRTQRFLAGDNVLNIANKPYLYCHDWWLERIPDDTLKRVEGLLSASNPNSGQVQQPPITVLQAYRDYLYENGVRNKKEVWWNRISRKYHVQSPIPDRTLGMAWDGDGNADLRPRIALVGSVFTKFAKRLVTSRGSVVDKSPMILYYSGAVSLVHEIIHLTATGRDNDDLYGYGDIISRNEFLIDRIIDGQESNDDLNEFDRLQYTADAYAWYCLSAYLSSVSEVTLDFSTSLGTNADGF